MAATDKSDIPPPTGLKSLLLVPAIRQLIAIVAIAISIALGITLYISIQEPTFEPLDYQVNSQNMSSIIDTLEKANIPYKFDTENNVVYVPIEDKLKAKMKLSAAGVQKDDSFNYSFLNDQTGFGSSQFFENVRYLRALEGDLSKTISTIQGISAAQVHIAIPQNNTFADQSDKVTASVVVTMDPGYYSDKEKIRSIIQIVASSVPMLDPKNVSITDQYGHLLSSALNQDLLYNTEQLNYQNDLQGYYEKRIIGLITPLVGQNKASVRVYADLDFTQQESAKEEYDPNKVIRSEENSSQSNKSGASGTPGGLSNSPDEDSSSSKSSSGGNSSSQSVRNYDVGKSVSYTHSNVAKVKSLSVAVVVDNDVEVDPKTKKVTSKPLTQNEIDKITALVKATIGFDKDRGDQVTVINSAFTEVQNAEQNAHPIRIWEQPWFWDWTKRILGIILGFCILFFIYKNLSKYTRPIELPKQEKPDPLALMMDDQDETSKNLKELKAEGFNKLKEMAATDPHRIASIMKIWVGK